MTHFQRWMAAWACLGMLIGPVSQSWGADAPATQAAAQHLDLTYVPAEAVAAIVVHPQAVLTGPDAEWLPTEVITAQGMKETGVDPVKIQEAVVVFASPTRGTDPDFAAIVRFSEAYSKTAVTAKLVGREKAVAGKTVVELPGARATWLYLADDKTIVIGMAPLVEKMLAAKDADSPLIGLLKKVDVSPQLTAVFSIDAVRPMMKQAMAAAPPVPPPFQDFLKLPDLVSAILFRVNVGEKFSANLTLRATDEAAAQETERIVNQGLAMAHQAIVMQMAGLQRGSDDPVQQAAGKYTARIVDQVFSRIKPARSGQNVSISVETNSSIAMLGVLPALLLPAVQASREAARRMQSSNNLKQISLALLNFHSAHRQFPARAIFDKQGKPLLSWRVQILPFIEEKELFNRFHLDEPWDSEHNKTLIGMMPAIYRNPNRAADDKTNFLVPVGKGTVFGGDKGLKITEIRDGTSNTLMVVEANEDRAVIWTKPDDLEVDLEKPLAGLGEFRPGVFEAAFCDGSVRTIPSTISEKTLKALFTHSGGEVIDKSEF